LLAKHRSRIGGPLGPWPSNRCGGPGAYTRTAVPGAPVSLHPLQRPRILRSYNRELGPILGQAFVVTMSALNLEHISKIYPPQVSLWKKWARAGGSPKRGFQALSDVSLTVEHGEFFGLLGPNGAGKTTMISILAGLAQATSGRASVCGYDVVSDYKQARRSLGVVPQELVYDPFFTVRETLRLQSGYFGLHKNDDWIDEILLNLGLADKADSNMRALSGGMKRRVLVAQALVHRPPVI